MSWTDGRVIISEGMSSGMYKKVLPKQVVDKNKRRTQEGNEHEEGKEKSVNVHSANHRPRSLGVRKRVFRPVPDG